MVGLVSVTAGGDEFREIRPIGAVLLMIPLERLPMVRRHVLAVPRVAAPAAHDVLRTRRRPNASQPIPTATMPREVT